MMKYEIVFIVNSVIIHSDIASIRGLYVDIVNHLKGLENHPIVRSRAGSIKAPVIRATYSDSTLVPSNIIGISNLELTRFFPWSPLIHRRSQIIKTIKEGVSISESRFLRWEQSDTLTKGIRFIIRFLIMLVTKIVCCILQLLVISVNWPIFLGQLNRFFFLFELLIWLKNGFCPISLVRAFFPL